MFWKFAVVGLLFIITLLLSMIKLKVDGIERLLIVPDAELPVYEEVQ